MCDTIVALKDATTEGIVLFGKNSDRERNEAQSVEFAPRAEHAPDAHVACTYITIPQAPRTHAALLCRPFWMWGAEMGANEHGVVIGNEAVHARTPPQEDPALIGMDLLRLGLERAATAAEAVEVIIALLERHGQGGSCGHLSPRYYHNSFIIADPHEAFVLETMRREWLVARAQGVRSISNIYSIGREAHRVSAGLDMHIRDAGWSHDILPDYAAVMADPQRDTISHGRARCTRSTTLLQRAGGHLTAADMMAILRDHGAMAETEPDWHPQHAATRTICMHAADGERGGQTVGSLVSELRDGRAVHWVTGTAAPCTSIFKPVFADMPTPPHGVRPTDRFDPQAMWWQHERLHRAMLGDFPIHLAAICDERDAMEADFHARVTEVAAGGDDVDRAEVIAACWEEAMWVEERWMAELDAATPPGEAAYRASWLEMNRRAGVTA